MITAKYEIILEGSNREISTISSWVAKAINNEDFIGKDCIDVEEYNDFEGVQNLAIDMAKIAKNAKFEIIGSISESVCDEDMCFIIAYNGIKLICKYSDWVHEYWPDCYENYEEFCEQFCDDNGKPLYTEEEYKTFSDGSWWYCGKEIDDFIDESRYTEELAIEEPQATN